MGLLPGRVWSRSTKSPTPVITAETTTAASGDGTEEQASGGYMHPVPQKRWLIGGVIKSTEPGTQ